MKNRLRVIRAEKELTQAQLAHLCGISRTTLAAVERGAIEPSGQTIAKLVKGLNMPVGEIFFDFM